MVAYWSGAGTAFDGSKTKIERFMPLGKESNKPKVSEEQRNLFNKQMQEYLDKIKNGK